MVKFVWVSLVCCGVANGLVYGYVKSPEKYLYMLVVAVVCCLLLVIHYRSTRKWCESRNGEDNRDYDEDHFPIFINSTFVAFLLMLIACVFCHAYVVIGLLTMLISFIVASLREAIYT